MRRQNMRSGMSRRPRDGMSLVSRQVCIWRLKRDVHFMSDLEARRDGCARVEE